jgi:hypothetical protein
MHTVATRPKLVAENKSLSCCARIASADSVCRSSAAGDADDTAHRYFFHLQTVGILRSLSKHLHVGANDIAHPADFGVAVDFVDASFLLAKAILQCLNCKSSRILFLNLKQSATVFAAE